MKKKSDENSLMTVAEVAKFLNVHANTLHRWDREGVLVAIRIGSRKDRRYRPKDIEKFRGDSLVAESDGAWAIRMLQSIFEVIDELTPEHRRMLRYYAHRMDTTRDRITLRVLNAYEGKMANDES